MRRVRNKSDLPAWLRSDRYKELHDLSRSKLVNQLAIRCAIYESLTSHDSCNSMVPKIDVDYWKDVENSAYIPYYSNFFEEMEPSGKEESRLLYHSGPVKAVNVPSAYLIGEEIRKKNLFGKGASQKGSHKTDMWRTPVSEILDGDSSVILKINLDSTDDLIFSALKKVLPICRERLCKADSNYLKANDSTFRKICDYRVIHFLDLKLWELKSGKNIEISVLAVTVFPHGEKGENHYIQTIKPFIDKIITNEFWQDVIYRKSL